VRRRTFLGGALAAVGLVGVGGLTASGLVGGGSSAAGESNGSTATTLPPSVKTEEVKARDLVQTEQVSGRLGYGPTRAIGGGPAGIVTALPDEGAVIDRGGTLWEVDGAPGPALLFGDRPMWRKLSSGVDAGVDITALEENLVALGIVDATTLTVDDRYTSATATAVKKWQKARGVEQTGTVAPTDVVMATAPVRVASRKAATGDQAGGEGVVLEVTGAEQIVSVPLDTAKASVAHAADAVTIELDGGTTITGTVRSVGTVVHSDEQSQSNYVDVVIAIDGGQTAGLDDAPVSVNFTRSAATGVLSVSVRALLALAEGGYAVERVTPTGTELVPVKLGAYADGFVQITGAVNAGDKVVVA
jgi:peptidoglycan hydrolase-like protein with peptidoglycan-binding domain